MELNCKVFPRHHNFNTYLIKNKHILVYNGDSSSYNFAIQFKKCVTMMIFIIASNHIIVFTVKVIFIFLMLGIKPLYTWIAYI